MSSVWTEVVECGRAVRSAPHARGPQDSLDLHADGVGTTPARAGTTGCPTVPRSTSWDHPRTRGDHCTTTVTTGPPRGPPPHARGPRHPRRGSHRGVGTTPARAGTTLPQRATDQEKRDHPRTRGDHSTRTTPASVIGGPPPHARGPLQRRSRRLGLPGTTPARAGTTGMQIPSRSSGWDHPRTRGDHFSSSAASRAFSGPPPHARGPLLQLGRQPRVLGTTPARAGTTGRDQRLCQADRWFFLTFEHSGKADKPSTSVLAPSVRLLSTALNLLRWVTMTSTPPAP